MDAIRSITYVNLDEISSQNIPDDLVVPMMFLHYITMVYLHLLNVSMDC